MIRTLRRKFVVITMLLVSAILLAVFFGIWIYNKSSMEQEGYRTLQMALERHGGEAPKLELGGKMPEGIHQDPVFTVLVRADGQTILLSSDRISVSEEQLTEIVKQVLDRGESQGELSEYDLRYMVDGDDKGGTRIAFASQHFEKNTIREVLLTTAIFIAGAFLVFLMASILLARWVLRPVERSWEQQSRFMADASHELKTPLTIILANSGILKASPDTDSDQMVWVSSTEKEAKRMKTLVDDMLFLAKRDESLPLAEKTPTDFSSVVETEALAFESVAFEKGFAVEVDVEPGIQVLGDTPRLKQLVAILVDNAVKYAKEGSTVRVTARRNQANAAFSVFNEGAPIPPEQQKHLFERFYRMDRSRSTEGSGLGLSIARAIAAEHKGKITVHSEESGTVFTVYIPFK